jgi:hypothetical protein
VKNGKDRLDRIEEVLWATWVKIAENDTQMQAGRKEHDREMAELRQMLTRSRAEHDREMKEIRALFKQMIRRIAG